MPLTRSRNTSGAPLAVGKDGVALRRSSRTSSLPTPSTPSTSSSRGGQAPSSAKQHSKSFYKAVEPKAQPLSLSRERESSSPEERAPTVASRARSSLSRCGFSLFISLYRMTPTHSGPPADLKAPRPSRPPPLPPSAHRRARPSSSACLCSSSDSAQLLLTFLSSPLRA